MPHPDMTIDGKIVSFAHLDPRLLVCQVPTIRRQVTIEVSFANHCYSVSFKAAVHHPSWSIMDRGTRRAFDRARYEASMLLPSMIESLPAASVWQLPHDRNFVHVMVLSDGSGNDYPMFFTLRKRGITGRADLCLIVESAYPKPAAELKRQIGGCAKVTFPVLCARTFQGKPTVFRRRR